MIEESEDIRIRFVALRYIKAYIDNADFAWKDDPQPDEITAVIDYLKRYNISIPHLPEGQLPEDKKVRMDIIKAMYRAWASIDCLNSMCHIVGEAK